MSDSSDGPRTCRVAALAVGLAFADREFNEAVEELLDEAEHRVDVLAHARRRSREVQIVDARTQARAVGLLTEAMERCSRSLSVEGVARAARSPR